MPSIMVGMDQYDDFVDDEARSQVSTVRPEQDDKLLTSDVMYCVCLSGCLNDVQISAFWMFRTRTSSTPLWSNSSFAWRRRAARCAAPMGYTASTAR